MKSEQNMGTDSVITEHQSLDKIDKIQLLKLAYNLIDSFCESYSYNSMGADYEMCNFCRKKTEKDDHDSDCSFVMLRNYLKDNS